MITKQMADGRWLALFNLEPPFCQKDGTPYYAPDGIPGGEATDEEREAIRTGNAGFLIRDAELNLADEARRMAAYYRTRSRERG